VRTRPTWISKEEYEEMKRKNEGEKYSNEDTQKNCKNAVPKPNRVSRMKSQRSILIDVTCDVKSHELRYEKKRLFPDVVS
jgi:hypothetical protein